MAKKKQTWTHTVSEIDPQTRIVDYCGQIFAMLGSKSATKKAIAAGRIFLNGQKATTGNYLKRGDKIQLIGAGIRQIKPYKLDLDISYEDDHILIVNKPGGIAVNGNRFKTLENALVGQAQTSTQNDALPRPIACHRLDVPTKGIVLFAKTKSALTTMGKAFQENRIQKQYIAIVHGQPPENGIINSPVDSKPAETQFETMEVAPSKNFQHLSLVALKPITGRTHQLRIHLKDIGHLIVGDKLYAEQNPTILGKGLFLCSTKLMFKHPATTKLIDLSIPPPDKFLRLLQRERERYDR